MLIKSLLASALLFSILFPQAPAAPDSSGLITTALTFASDSLSPVPDLLPDPVRGRALYLRHCLPCHGAKGDGRGPVARFLEPRPRDFTLGVYKLRSTPTGTVPTDGDLLRTISKGIAGTAMPGFAGLSGGERWQLVQFVKSLSKRFAESPAPAPLTWTSHPPELTGEALARGAEIYAGLECAKCHGDDGRGNGPTAYTLKDSQGRPIFPFDMTRGRKMKSGPAVDDIFRVLMTGLGGTPMPSYQESLSEEEAWLLSLYVKSLFVDE